MYIYGANLIASATGFLYWVIAAKFVSSNVLGTASAVISLTSIVSALSTLGLGTAILRVGPIYRDKIGEVTCTALVLDLSATVIMVLGGLIVFTKILGYSWSVFFIIPLALVWVSATTLRPVFIATRNAKYLSYAQTLSAIVRIGIGIAILIALPTVIGVLLGYLLGSLAVIITLLVVILQKKLLELRTSKTHAIELLRAGIPIWLPNIITVLGTQLGVVFTYSLRGGSEAGYLYIAQAIALAIDSARVAIASALISSIATNRFNLERLSQAIRLIYTLLLPLNIILIFCPEPLLQLINTEYIVAANLLRLFATSNIMLSAVGLVATHIYAKGDYKYTLLINTATSITRITLYTMLTPLYGATGVATAYLTGTIVTTILVMVKIIKEKVIMPWREMFISTLIAIFINITIEGFRQTLITVATALTMMYAILLVLKIIRKEELLILARAVLRSR